MSPRRGLGIDAEAPSLLVDSVLKTGKMAQDMQWRCCIVRENKNLLRKINQIYRNKVRRRRCGKVWRQEEFEILVFVCL